MGYDLALIFILFSIVTSGCLSSSYRRTNDSELDRIVRHAWLNLGSSTMGCDTFDYFPECGIRNFYCHLSGYIDYRHFQKSIGTPIFLSGPHGPDGLDLNSPDRFGHYNPLFVRKIRSILIPAIRDREFAKATLPVYQKYISRLARIHYVTYRKIQANPDFLQEEKERYLNTAIAAKEKYDFERFFLFMNPEYLITDDRDILWNRGFDAGWDGNVVKTSVAFWIRRHIDGTDTEFFLGLNELLQVYDPDFLTNPSRMDN